MNAGFGALPTGDQVTLDHVGWFVPDLEAAGRAFERLGFAVSPINTHYNAGPDGKLALSGTLNRLVTPPLGYLEFLGKGSDTPLSAQLDEGLRRYTGLHLIAFGHADVPAVERRLAAQDVPLQPTVHLRRPVEPRPDSPIVAATVLRAAPGSMPEGRIQFCRHETPDLIWRREYMTHANGAEAVTGLLLVSSGPAEAADRLGRFALRPTATGSDGSRRITTDRGTVTIVDAQAAARLLPQFAAPSLPFMAATAIRCNDLEATRAALRRGGVQALTETPGCITIGPRDAVGAWLVFHAAGAAPAWADPHA